MDIFDWRKKIDELDGKLVELSQPRAGAAIAIDDSNAIPICRSIEPERRARSESVMLQKINGGPLAARDLAQIYRTHHGRDRSVQKQKSFPSPKPRPTARRSIRNSKTSNED